MHPHIPRPRRKATRTCTDTAGVVRTVHGEFMWPFTARVNENRTDRTDRCRCNLPPPKGRPQADLCSTVKRPTPGLRALPPMTAQIATVFGPALDEPGALQQPSTVHVSEGSKGGGRALERECQHRPRKLTTRHFEPIIASVPAAEVTWPTPLGRICGRAPMTKPPPLLNRLQLRGGADIMPVSTGVRLCNAADSAILISRCRLSVLAVTACRAPMGRPTTGVDRHYPPRARSRRQSSRHLGQLRQRPQSSLDRRSDPRPQA